MANNTLVQSIEDIIPIIYSDIESKKSITSLLRKQYLSSSEELITIKAFKLSDFIDDFDITISQSLQAIQTLQTEIWNLKEKIEMIESCKEQQQLYKNNIEDQEPQPEQRRPQKLQSSNYFNKNIIPRKIFQINEDDCIDYLKRNQSEPRFHKEDMKEYNSHIKNSIEEHIGKITYNSIKTPIRQSLRQMIKEVPYNDENTNYSNCNNNFCKVNPEDKIQMLLMKISKVDSYRKYFAEKYGEGCYETFIKKLNNKEFKRKTLEDELNIIAELMTQHLNKHNEYYSTRNLFNRNGNCNKSQQLKQNRSSLELQSNSSIKQMHKMNTIPTKPRKYDYVQPINFSLSSYLRKGDNGIKTVNQMSFSKDKAKR